MWPAYVGLVGDSLTFVGGMILAVDAIGKQREFQKIRTMAQAVSDPLLAKVKFTKEGISLVDHADVELVFIRRSVNRAMWGSILVAVGFVCLLLVRIHEISQVPHPGS